LRLDDYVADVAEMVSRTPAEIVFHRLTGTAAEKMLLAPTWCSKKWQVLNAITAALAKNTNRLVSDKDLRKAIPGLLAPQRLAPAVS
jgi:hypothetical protein